MPVKNRLEVRPTATTSHPLRWRALWVSQIAAFMALLDVSIVNVALPSIQAELDVSPATAQWVVSGYALAFAVALVPAGRLGDLVGRRRMFLIGLSAFVLTSALTGAAPTVTLLLVARLLQGVAGGILIPQNTGLAQELFNGGERGRAFGILGATVGVAMATGPVVGGVILTAFSGPDAWRWVFYVNVPIGMVALVLAARILPAVPREHRPSTHLDVVGSLLLGAGVLCLLLPMVYADTGGLRSLGWLFGVAVLFLAGFASWESHTARRGRQPLLDPRLARTGGFVAGSAIGMVYFIGFSGVLLVLAVFYQHGLGYSPLQSGLAVTPLALGMAVSAMVAGRLVARVGRWLTLWGLTASCLGLVVAAVLFRQGAHDSAWWTVLPLLVAGLGGGMVTSPNMTLTLQHVPTSLAGVAGGALQTAQRIGTGVGTALLTTIFYHQLMTADEAYRPAVSDTLLCSAAVMAAALLLAVTDLARHRPQPRAAEG